MKILFTASEMSPYIFTGGLADFTREFPEALADNDVSVIRVVPFYRQMAAHPEGLRDTGITLQIPVGLTNYTAEIWADEKHNPKTYYVRRDEFFDRTYIYGRISKDYEDNFERFVFFQKAVVALIDNMQLEVDVVHSNDWQTALIPAFLRNGINGAGRMQREKTVFTIHDLAYQGVFPGASFPLSNLPFSCFNVHEMEFYNQVNCMKSGIVVSDFTTTVSPSYASSICSTNFGCGLDGVLLDKQHHFRGILNGISYENWTPETDPEIALPFTADSFEGKRACKEDLLKTLALKCDEKTAMRPLIGMMMPLVDGMGYGVTNRVIEQLLQLDIQLVVMGVGNQFYSDICGSWAARFPDQVAVCYEESRILERKILAGSDMFLAPAVLESFALYPLHALRYGTIPIVHATGGCKDIIRDVLEEPKSGNGFIFRKFDEWDLLAAVQKAVLQFRGADAVWQQLMRRVMQEQHTWQPTVEEYLGIYKDLCHGHVRHH